MTRKTIGLYKRYTYVNIVGMWVVSFKRHLNWVYNILPTVRIPDDFARDFEELLGARHLEWEITLKRDTSDPNGVLFFSDICSVPNPQNRSIFEFTIPQELWDTIKKEGVRYEWQILLRPYNLITGEFVVFFMDKCAKLHSEHVDNVINKSYDKGDLFGWLYGEDYSPLYQKREPSKQVSIKSTST